MKVRIEVLNTDRRTDMVKVIAFLQLFTTNVPKVANNTYGTVCTPHLTTLPTGFPDRVFCQPNFIFN